MHGRFENLAWLNTSLVSLLIIIWLHSFKLEISLGIFKVICLQASVIDKSAGTGFLVTLCMSPLLPLEPYRKMSDFLKINGASHLQSRNLCPSVMGNMLALSPLCLDLLNWSLLFSLSVSLTYLWKPPRFMEILFPLSYYLRLELFLLFWFAHLCVYGLSLQRQWHIFSKGWWNLGLFSLEFSPTGCLVFTSLKIFCFSFSPVSFGLHLSSWKVCSDVSRSCWLVFKSGRPHSTMSATSHPCSTGSGICGESTSDTLYRVLVPTQSLFS